MGTSYSAAQFTKKIAATAKAIEKARLDALDEIGKDMIVAARKAVRGDVGSDEKFTGGKGKGSGWKAEFRTGFEKSPGGITFGPKGQGRGPWRVAQSGRHSVMKTLAGGASGPVLGQGKISKKTGKSLGKTKRWNGKTDPMNTWDKAKVEIEKVVPPKIPKTFVNAVRKVY